MIKISVYTSFCVTVLLLLGCSGNPSRKEDGLFLIKTDPFMESFKGKSIKMVTSSEAQSSVIDTLDFDPDGRVMSERKLYSISRYGFDSVGNQTRSLTLNDIPSNYMIDYEKKGNVVLQNWYLLDHLNWELEEQVLGVADRVVKFLFDDSQKLQEEINLSIGEVTKYEYIGSNISVKEVYPEGANKPSLKWTYHYGEKGFLEKAECTREGELIKEHFFGNDGLVDSTRMNGYTLLYSYQYY